MPKRRIAPSRRKRVTPWKAMAVFGFLGGVFSHPHWVGAVEGAGLTLCAFFLLKVIHSVFAAEE